MRRAALLDILGERGVFLLTLANFALAALALSPFTSLSFDSKAVILCLTNLVAAECATLPIAANSSARWSVRIIAIAEAALTVVGGTVAAACQKAKYGTRKTAFTISFLAVVFPSAIALIWVSSDQAKKRVEAERLGSEQGEFTFLSPICDAN
jgi:hypothetical protein